MVPIIETGSTLKNTRMSMGLSLEEVSKDLDIPTIELEQIEAGTIGFAHNIYELKDKMVEYAKYLGLNTDEVEKKFNEYMFDYTSKIQIQDIEAALLKSEKELEDPDRIASPYTKIAKKKVTLPFIIFGIVALCIVIFVIIWIIGQLSDYNAGSTIIGFLD